MVSHGSLKNPPSVIDFQARAIHQLPRDPSTQEFSRVLREQKILVSPSGRHLACLWQNQSNQPHLDVVHEQRHVRLPISQGSILWVAPKQLLLWGQGISGHPSGVFLVSDQAVAFLQRLDRLDQIIKTPAGPMLKGGNHDDEPGFERYILPQGQGFALVADNGSISIHGDGRVSFIEEHLGRVCHNLWNRDGSLEEIREFDPRAQVRVLRWQDGFAYIIDQGDSFSFDTVGIEMFDFEPHQVLPGQVEYFWASPSQKHIFFLVKRPERGRLDCSYRQLYLDGQLVEDADGFFQMGPDDLRWSRDDSQFITRVKMHQLDLQGRSFCVNRLITSAGRVFDAPADFDLQEMAVDNYGDISFYVLSDGQLHYPFYYGEPLDPATYVWNLRHFKKRLSGNRLVQNRIEHFRLPRRA